jgi:hypothetical protein
MDKRNEQSVYLIAEEIIQKDRTPEDGIEEALMYIKNCSNKYRAVSERGFLQYLASKDDAISMIAKKKLDE